MRLKTFLAAAAVLTLTTTLAIADAARQAAQQCALNTNAPGNYNISNAPGLPHVIPGQGGTEAGAARINDCLTDTYQVQYGAKGGAVATAGVARTAPTSQPSGRLNCAEILNRTPGRAATYAFGSALVAGAIGASAQAGVYQRNLNRCLAQAPAQRVDPNAAIYVGCSRRGGVMRRGTSLCVSP